MQPLPHAGLVPVPQTAPARHARAEPHLLWQVLPLDPGMQHVQDPAQHFPVRQRPAAGIPESALTLRQQRLQAVPQLIRHDPRRRPHTGPNAQLPRQSRQPGPIHLFVLAVVRTVSPAANERPRVSAPGARALRCSANKELGGVLDQEKVSSIRLTADKEADDACRPQPPAFGIVKDSLPRPVGPLRHSKHKEAERAEGGRLLILRRPRTA